MNSEGSFKLFGLNSFTCSALARIKRKVVMVSIKSYDSVILMKGRKCSLIFMRKVANRLAVLEERYKNENPQTRAKKINEELMQTFCVGRQEIKEWKRIVNVMKSQCRDIPTLPPSHYSEIAKLPKDKQQEIIEKVANENLTYQETALLVQQTLGNATMEYPLYNVWKTFQIDDAYGQDYPGRTPHQIVANLLYYYTEEDANVCDPMAGGGTTIDVCKRMNRNCRAFDINPVREDVEQNDVLKGIPHSSVYDFIFLDPPYYVQKDDYIRNEFNESLESFYDAIRKTLQNCHDVLKEKGILALMLKPMGLHENGQFQWEDLTLKCHAVAEQIGFKLIKRIVAPLSTQQYDALDVHRAKEGHYMLNTLRDILVYQK